MGVEVMREDSGTVTLSVRRHEMRQWGFTLVEIMVGLVLGLLVVNAVIQVFLGTQQSGRIQQAASRMQENGRFAIDMLTHYVRLAGYVTNPWDKGSMHWDPSGGERGFPAPTSVTDGPNGPVPGFTQGFALGQVVMGGSDNINGMDSVRVRYQGAADGSITDCQGNAVTLTQMVDITLSLTANDPDYPDEGRSLQCRVIVVDGNTDPPIITVRGNQPLVAGLQDMQIWYGLSQGAAGIDAVGRLTGATTYLTADQVTANNLWNRVISVQISLLVSSNQDTLANQPQTYTFPSISSTTTLATDRRLRYVVGATTNIRNQAP